MQYSWDDCVERRDEVNKKDPCIGTPRNPGAEE